MVKFKPRVRPAGEATISRSMLAMYLEAEQFAIVRNPALTDAEKVAGLYVLADLARSLTTHWRLYDRLFRRRIWLRECGFTPTGLPTPEMVEEVSQ